MTSDGRVTGEMAGLRRRLECSPVPTWGVAIASAVLSGLVFVRWTATAGWAWPWFLASAVLLVYLPGRGLIAMTRLDIGQLERLSLSLLVGTAASAAGYRISAAIGSPWLVLVLPVTAIAILLLRHPDDRMAIIDSPPPLGWWAVGLAAAGGLVLAPFAILPTYYRNLATLPGGGLSFSSLPDVVLHLWVSRELVHTVPPQIPFFPGQPLQYHYGADLVIALFSRLAGLSVLDLAARFVPTLYAVQLLLAAFCFGRRWLSSVPAALVFCVLAVLGEDFSFIPGLWRGSEQLWATEFFGAPTIVSLYLWNPMLPALGFLFGVLTCVGQFWKSGRPGWLVLVALLTWALMEFKVFTAFHVLASLGVTSLIFLARYRDLRPALALLAAGAASAPLMLLAWNASAGRASWSLHAWYYLPFALKSTGLSETVIGRQLIGLFAAEPFTAVNIGLFVFLGLPGYLLGSLGLRVMGLAPLFRAAFSRVPSEAARVHVACFVLLGPLVSFLTAVIPSGYPPPYYNDAIWFFVQAKYLVWIFVMESLIRHWARAGTLVRCAGLAAVFALTLPTTIQFMARQLGDRPVTIGPQRLDLIHFLDKETDPGEVVYSREDVAKSAVALSHCRGLALELFPYYFIPRRDWIERNAERESFWRAWEQGTVQWDPLLHIGASYLAIDKRRDRPLSSPGLERVFENSDFVSYKLAHPASQR